MHFLGKCHFRMTLVDVEEMLKRKIHIYMFFWLTLLERLSLSGYFQLSTVSEHWCARNYPQQERLTLLLAEARCTTLIDKIC